MAKNVQILICFIIVIFFSFSGIEGQTKSKKGNKQIAFVSILPQRDIVQAIAGDRFKVNVLIGQGQNPHSYTPTGKQMAKLSEAVLFFRIGMEFEEAILPKLEKTTKSLAIIDVRKGIKMRKMEEGHEEHGKHEEHDHEENEEHGKHEEHDHEENEEHGKHEEHDHEENEEHGKHEEHDHDEHKHHHHEGDDPHIWLSPALVKTMAITIKDALVKHDPDHKADYEKNLKKLHRQLESLDNSLKKSLAPIKGTPLYVFHPAFGYFADHYGLHQKAVEVGGKEPSARALTKLIEQAKQDKVKVIFVQPQYSHKSAKTLAKQIGCVVVSINPLPENYLKEMRILGNTIKKGLKK